MNRKDDVEARMWMFGIARHVNKDYLRGRRRHIALADRLRNHLTTTERAIESAVDGRYLDLEAAIGDLPAVDQEIIRLVHWDGLSLAEVALHLRRPAGTVRSRYHRARRRLGGILDERDRDRNERAEN